MICQRLFLIFRICRLHRPDRSKCGKTPRRSIGVGDPSRICVPLCIQRRTRPTVLLFGRDANGEGLPALPTRSSVKPRPVRRRSYAHEYGARHISNCIHLLVGIGGSEGNEMRVSTFLGGSMGCLHLLGEGGTDFHSAESIDERLKASTVIKRFGNED
jgi:hypothetical protein